MNNKARIICICGKAQRGKDTTAVYMKEELENLNKKVIIFHYADLLKFYCKQYFGWDGEKDEKGRSLLQEIGTGIFRKRDKNYWVKSFLMLYKTALKNNYDYVLIPDCRFKNEIRLLCKKYPSTLILKVVRGEDFQDTLTEEQRKHISETALDNIKVDKTIRNYGSKEDLKVLIKDFCKDLEEK